MGWEKKPKTNLPRQTKEAPLRFLAFVHGKKTQNKNMKVRPIGDRVLVKPAKEEETKKGGIIIPDSAKEKPQEGKVIAIGTGKTDESGKKVPFNVKAGDRVLISKYGGTEIKIDGEEYQILREDDILGIVE